MIVKKCRDCLRVALLYPSIYQVAVASLAYQLIYYMLNSMEHVVAERFVLPSLDELSTPLRSLETGALLKHFDVIIIPVSYELDLMYAVHALHVSGVEPYAEKRRHPVIVVGGPVPSMNPAPFYPLADVIVIGEAEPTLPLLVETLYTDGVDALKASEGFLTRYTVEAGEKSRRVYVEDLDSTFHPILQFRIPGSGEPWGEALLVEISRGCRWMCRFCMEAFFTLPWRIRSFTKIREIIEEGVEVNKVSKVAFYSLSFFDHPDADRLLEYLAENKLEVSIGSLRADTLNRDRLEMLARLGQRTVTIAPETFSPRLSCAINKVIGRSTVEELVLEARRLGLHPKLYLMLGLPGEQDEDVKHAAEILSRLWRLSGGSMRVTVNPLVPKPWTPLQWHPFIDEKRYEARARLLRRAARNVDILSYRWAYAQAVIARGGVEAGLAVIDASREAPRLGTVLRALRKTTWGRKVLEGFEPGEELPWEKLVDPGYPVAALRRSFEAALSCLGRG
ncbi:B12-binding domain-containing radical SAM protein [Pyrolobus fumarii]|uniref:B12-binding domain-containing radical SAM protein n=1 Tax=Pyrolobus fumarii TaxID=54252 RepID=UPI00064E99BF|nr:radical SAM protein [Pyrolobus fumarii]